MSLTDFAPLIGYAFQKGKILDALSDIDLLRRDYAVVGSSFEATDIAALDKAGLITPTLQAFSRVSGFVAEMSADPAHHADAVKVMVALIGLKG